MNIGVNIDGVLFPWEDAVCLAIEERFGVELGPMTYWDAYKDTLGQERWDWIWSREGTDAVMGRTELVYPGVVEAINALTRHGDHEVHFVTHRDPRRTAVYTATFLHRHFGRHPWTGTHVVQSSVAKRTLRRWDVFIDDKPDTVHDFLANTNAKVFAPVRPWNVDELGDVLYENLCHYTDPATIVKWVGARDV
jgi:hypothetical protein